MEIINRHLYMSGLSCTKKMYYLNENQNKPEPSILHQTFKETAQRILAPNGIDLTGELLSININRNGKKQVYYNTLLQSSNGISTILDIIIIDENGKVTVGLIRPTTQLKDIHYHQAAFDAYCLSQMKYSVEKILLAYVNNEYLMGESISEDLIRTEDVTTICSRLQKKVSGKIAMFQKILRLESYGDESPIGEHCLKPEHCQFKDTCWKGMPTNNVFHLRSMKTSTKLGLYFKDIVSFEQLSENKNHKFTDNQMMQITAALSNKIIYQREEIRNWIDVINKSKIIYFLDFETFAPIVPICTGHKPFRRIPFQYSLDVYTSIERTSHNLSFLASPINGLDSRLEFAKALVDHLRSHVKSPIIVYNKAFEAGVINELANEFPELKKELMSIHTRLYDLMEIFRQMWYYDPRFKGSYSIKSILPVLIPELSYTNLPINNGEEASASYLQTMLQEPAVAAETRNSLLKYCQMDTYAMIEIYKFLVDLVHNPELKSKNNTYEKI